VQFGPADLRATFEMFRFYRPEVGLEALLQDANVDRISPRQLYHAVHNRPPDTIEGALKPGNYRPIDTFIAALSSVEFQQNLAAHLLQSFSEKRRLFFVHIPKTAGVDLATHLISRYPSISTTLLDRQLTPDRNKIFLAIKHIVLEMACSDTIFISGHTHLGRYQTWAGNGIRFRDSVFTIVREPLEQIVSQINYTLGRIFSNEDPIPPDTAGWRKLFAVEDPDPGMSRPNLLRLAKRILHEPGVVVPNVICTFLGGGSCERALAQTVAHDLEVVEMKRLDRWAEEKWNVTHRTKRNSSEKFVSLEDFSAMDMEYIHEIIQEDTQYYQLVLSAYERHGTTAVKGSQLLPAS
jgi:hypothetical protein